LWRGATLAAGYLAWEFLASRGCLAVNAVAEEDLGRAAAASDVRPALLRLATGGGE